MAKEHALIANAIVLLGFLERHARLACVQMIASSMDNVFKEGAFAQRDLLGVTVHKFLLNVAIALLENVIATWGGMEGIVNTPYLCTPNKGYLFSLSFLHH